jgi:hypothetical protein
MIYLHFFIIYINKSKQILIINVIKVIKVILINNFSNIIYLKLSRFNSEGDTIFLKFKIKNICC